MTKKIVITLLVLSLVVTGILYFRPVSGGRTVNDVTLISSDGGGSSDKAHSAASVVKSSAVDSERMTIRCGPYDGKLARSAVCAIK